MGADAKIRSHDWDRLKEMILAGYREDMSNYDYKDYPLIFDIIHSRDPGASDMACFWLDHGYPLLVTGGRVQKTIAHAAAAVNFPDVLKKLIALGAEVNLADGDWNTPLWDAAYWGSAECVRVLLDAGADPDGFEERPDDLGGRGFDTPLSVAARAEIAKTLLDAGADAGIGMYPDSVIDEPQVKHFEDELISPLSRACLDGREDTARLLIARGADVNACAGQAMRCLAISEKPPIPLLDALIRAGADVNGPDGREPLRLAASAGNGELCAALLKAGARPIDEALPLAVRSGKWECVEALLKGKVGKGSDAIRMAAKAGRRDILDRLLDIYPGEGPGAALHGAIAGCRFELASEIMGMGADPDARDEGGMTPLIRLFSLDRCVDTWRQILNSPKRYVMEPGIGRLPWRPQAWELDEPDYRKLNLHRPRNWNKLIELCEEEAMELARQLIEAGADIRAKDDMGRSVLWHACHRSWLKSIPWLLDMGLDLGERDKDGISAFEAGCLSHESFTVEPMLSRGYDVNMQDRNGDTALLKCARDPKESSRYSSVIFHLIKGGADPDLKNNSGVSLRMMAEDNKELAFTLKWGEDD